MRSINVAVLSLGVVLVAACSGPESTGIPSGSRRSSGGGGTAGDFAGTFDTTGTGGDVSGAGGIDMGDAQASDPGDVVEAGTDDAQTGVGDAVVADAAGGDVAVARDATISDARDIDGASDAPSDVNGQDVITTATCNATPSQDSQCRSSRTPHRYVCPLSLGTPTGCTQISTGSTSAAYCCP